MLGNLRGKVINLQAKLATTEQEYRKALTDLQKKCPHSKVVAYSSNDGVFTSYDGACLTCGLRKGGIDEGLGPLESKPTKWDQNVSKYFSTVYSERFTFPPVEKLDKMTGFKK